MDLTSKELIQLTKEIDEKCIDFAQFITGITHKQVEGYFYFYYYSEWKTTKELLEIFKKEKEEINKSFYCKNESFVKNYYGEYCKKQCEECKLKSK